MLVKTIDFRELAKQNPWWEDSKAINSDPKLRDLDAAQIKWMPRLRKYMDLNKDILYSVRGPRQVGKTTFVKLLIREELAKRKPCDIFYYACDLVSNATELHAIIETFLQWSSRQSSSRKLVCIDEVSLVKGWESAYKLIADLHSLENKTFVMTGSSSWDLKHSVEQLGGRKGEASGEQNHKILLPMKFAEYAVLRNPKLGNIVQSLGLDKNEVRKGAFLGLMTQSASKWIGPLLPWQAELDALFDEYLLTGGVMSAVNQYYSKKEISNSTYELYLQLFFGDLAKLKRDEGTAKKVLSGILRHVQSPVGWKTIAKESGIPSELTVNKYADVLQSLFVLNIYHAFDQNHKQPKHRSQKKLQIPNPFFFHAFHGYLTNPAGDYFREAKKFLSDSEGKAALAEFVVGDHLARLAYNHHPTDLFDQSNFVFYVRNVAGETIDFVVRLPTGFIPVEVKYQNSIVPSDYKNLKKFEGGILATKSVSEVGTPHATIPVSMLLMFI